MLNQLLANALISGSIYTLMGIGFALIYRIVGFFYFTHGIIYALGAYLCFAFLRLFDLPMGMAIPGAIGCCVIIGLFFERAVYLPLRRKGATPLVLLFASIGLYIVTQNIIYLRGFNTFNSFVLC